MKKFLPLAMIALLIIAAGPVQASLISQGKPVTGGAYYNVGSEVFPFDNITDGRWNDTGEPWDWSFWLTPLLSHKV